MENNNCTQHIKDTLVEHMHTAYLDTLRHREQEIFRYLAILGPALGGFMWLFYKNVNTHVFTIVTAGTILTMLLGAFYSVALGYHYRYIVLLLAKIEVMTNTNNFVLASWPRRPKKLIKTKRAFLWDIPWCEPPEIINIFYWAFIIGIIGVTAVAWFYYKPNPSNTTVPIWLIIGGSVSALVGYLVPSIWFGCKLRNKCNEEEKEGKWPNLIENSTEQYNESLSKISEELGQTQNKGDRMIMKKYGWSIVIIMIAFIVFHFISKGSFNTLDYINIATMIILGITLIILFDYADSTKEMAKVSMNTFNATQRPLMDFSITEKVPSDAILRTETSAINHSDYHSGALKIQIEFYLIDNTGHKKFSPKSADGKPNDYYNGTITWYLQPNRPINGTHFEIIPSLDSAIKSQEDLLKYYEQSNGQLWMRINIFALDAQDRLISKWKQDWYFKRALTSEWKWIYEIDKNKLDQLLKANQVVAKCNSCGTHLAPTHTGHCPICGKIGKAIVAIINESVSIK